MEKKYTVELTREEANDIKAALIEMERIWGNKYVDEDEPGKKEVYKELRNRYRHLEDVFSVLTGGRKYWFD